MLDYFKLEDFAHQARYKLMACRMGVQSATEYIDKFQKCLLIFSDILEAEAKFIFEMNLVDWLSELELPSNYIDLHAMILCAKHISSI